MARRSTPAEPPTDQPDETSGDSPDTGSAPASASASARQEPAFFDWLRGLGMPRRAGWLGGVCAGVAARTGLDPILVRGIVVVLAVIGAPVVLLYALAWALLPDEHGGIHVQELGRGTVTRALPGILALFVVSFLPVTQGFWHVGALYWGDSGWGGAIARAAWTGVVLVVVIVLVVWLARRASGDPVWSPATTDDRPETVPSTPVDAASPDAAAPAVALPASASSAGSPAVAPLAVTAPDPGEPPARPTDASDDELAAWKTQQDEWKRQRAEWAAEQRRSEREKRQAEAHTRALESAESARERTRIRRLTRPRARAGVVFLVVGLAIVAAAFATLWASSTRGTTSAAWIIGAAVLVLVFGLGTVVVALARRRSGALTFFSVLAVLALAVSLVLPPDRALLFPGASITPAAGDRFAQLTGSTYVWVDDRDGAPRSTELWQLAGSIQVALAEGATVRLDVTSARSSVSVSLSEYLADDTQQYSVFRGENGRLILTIGDGDPDVILRIWTGEGWLSVTPDSGADSPVTVSQTPEHIERWDVDGEALEPLRPGIDDPSPTPTPVPTEGVAP